jgi:hypothetical protein
LGKSNSITVLGLEIPPRYERCICWPYITGAHDYHWVIEINGRWYEQDGRAGPLNAWDNPSDMMKAVYLRRNKLGQLKYPAESAFLFDKKKE